MSHRTGPARATADHRWTCAHTNDISSRRGATRARSFARATPYGLPRGRIASIPDYFSNTGANATSTQSTEPNQHDYDQLALIYGHLDSTTTLKSTTAAIARGGPTGADGDGTPVDASRARGSWYVENLGGGRYLITHIRWID